jgi:hypothetical protein
MRIISKFHDYYDAAQADGFDRSLVFLREAAQYPNCQRHGDTPAPLKAFARFAQQHSPGCISLDRRGPGKNIRVEVDFGLILFAGKLYPFARVEYRSFYGGRTEAPLTCYSRDELVAALAPYDYDLDERDKRTAKGRALWGADPVTTATFFALSGSEQLREEALAQRLAVASWERDGDLGKINPTLAEFQLYRHLHAWQAFQELSMFWGNLAAPDRVPVTIADKDRIAQHGFDKWSFRRMPTKA